MDKPATSAVKEGVQRLVVVSREELGLEPL